MYTVCVTVCVIMMPVSWPRLATIDKPAETDAGVCLCCSNCLHAIVLMMLAMMVSHSNHAVVMSLVHVRLGATRDPTLQW